MKYLISMILLTSFFMSCSEDKKTDFLETVFIPAGSFQLGNLGTYNGDADEKPTHTVTLSKAFYMGKYEVTQKQYETIMGQNPSKFKGENLPVEEITWFNAVEFCNKLSLKDGLTQSYAINGKEVTINWNANGWRLPTEAEWEYSCKGGSITDFYTGNLVNTECSPIDENFSKIGWNCCNAVSSTHPVGIKMPNTFGLYDMSGNVWEWCWDWYNSTFYTNDAVTDPKGEVTGTTRVVRGGSWYNTTKFCRSSNRNDHDPEATDAGIYGFRVCRSN